MSEIILRPVTLPGALIGQAVPCDLYDARGNLLLRCGNEVSEMLVSASASHRVYCDAPDASRFADIDPLATLRDVGEALSVLDELASTGTRTFATEYLRLAEECLNAWRFDPDACIGYLRLAHPDRPSVCHALLAGMFVAELADAHGAARAEQLHLVGAALTMNLGSMRLHDQMFRHPGVPEYEFRELLDGHPEKAARLLTEMGEIPPAWVAAVAQHHENVDGSGYPARLARGEICLNARMLRVADVLAARLRGRRMRPPLYWNIHRTRDREQMVRHVFGNDLELLDQHLVRLLIGRLGPFPPGSLVRLSNGELAVISRRGGRNSGTPREAMSFLDANGRRHDRPRRRSISLQDCRIQGYAHDAQPRLPDYDWQPLWGYRQQAPRRPHAHSAA